MQKSQHCRVHGPKVNTAVYMCEIVGFNNASFTTNVTCQCLENVLQTTGDTKPILGMIVMLMIGILGLIV